MSDTIKELIEKLESETNDVEQGKIYARIEELKNEAERVVRRHQREVSYDTKEFTIEMVVNKYHEGIETDTNELFVPDYQRDFVWSVRNQSRLIESLLIGLPVPYVFVADVKSDDPDLDGRIEIVDGSQRVRTLHAFVKNTLQLEELVLMPELNGFRFCDLPNSRQRRFKRIAIRTIELSNCTEDTRRDLFERINTGSDELKEMEKRKGSKHGSSPLYKEVLILCAERELFKKAAPLGSSKAKRGEAMEFVLRFFAYREGYLNFSHSVRDFLNEYLEKNKNVEEQVRSVMVSEFDAVMIFVDKYFPTGFRKSTGSKTTPRVRFEALAVGTALALDEQSTLVPKGIAEWIFGEEFMSLTTGDGANSRVRVKNRIEFVRNKLLGEL